MGLVRAPAGHLLAAGDVATAGTDDVVVFDEGFAGDVAALIERSGGVPGRIFDRIGVATARGMTPASEARLRSSSGVSPSSPIS
jgi:hypothetical protein